ncbi:hypothetical protein [Falsirhodobacter xinxiangensis]|uniref:hypothetical protein n=1 Tax=Falsirhodobacter xinxiangensis TaxID=2530049 RepID=UPI0010AA7662|nr:hypothetical protein [Rhodobacter xinxiangensis]
MGIAKDARSFDFAHALVPREDAILEERGLIETALDKRGSFSLPPARSGVTRKRPCRNCVSALQWIMALD